MNDAGLADMNRSWDEARLESAFQARFGVSAPDDLRSEVLAAVAAADRPRLAWLPRPGRAAIGAVVAIIVLAVTGLGGLAGIGPAAPLRELSGDRPFEIRPGPPGHRILATADWALEFPDGWLAYDSFAAYSGGSAIAVLTDLPMEPRCGSGHVDVNCVYEQRLEPGTFRLFLSGGAYRGDTIFSRADLEGFRTTRLTMAGMPAIRDERTSPPDSYYLGDREINWSIALPTSITNVIRLEAIVRGPGEAARVAQLEALAASLRFTPPPVPLPADPVAAADAGYRAIRSLATEHRRGYLGDADTTALTHYDCFDPRPNTVRDARIRVGPGGDLGATVPVSCIWRIEAVADSIWEARLAFDWSAAGTSGRHEEVLWLDAAGDVLGLEHHGDPPPAVDPADPSRTAPPPP